MHINKTNTLKIIFPAAIAAMLTAPACKSNSPESPAPPPASQEEFVDKSSPVSLEDLIGSYEETCSSGGGNYKSSYKVEPNGTVTSQVFFREGPRCGGNPGEQVYLIKEVFKLQITGSNDRFSKTTETMVEIIVTPLTDAQAKSFNNAAIHGITNWQKNKPTNILGPKGPYQKGQKRYNIVGIKDGIIYAGAKPSGTRDGRPSKLSPNVGRKALKLK